MTYTIKALASHPGHNPQFFKFYGLGKRPSRWLPHQGKREMARRVRQAERKAK